MDGVHPDFVPPGSPESLFGQAGGTSTCGGGSRWSVPTRSAVILLVWIAFLADLLIGAGLLLSRDATLRNVGLGMVLGAALVMAGFTLYYYVQQRRRNTD